jgi:hypothetical protein
MAQQGDGMTEQKTLTTILDEHQLRMTRAGELVFDAREIVRKRLKPGQSEDRDLFDKLQTLHHLLGGSPIDIEARPIASALDFLATATVADIMASAIRTGGKV